MNCAKKILHSTFTSIISGLLICSISVPAFAQYEGDYDVPTLPEPVQPYAPGNGDFQIPLEPVIPPDPKFSSDASVVDYTGVPSNIVVPSQFSFSIPDFSATMSAYSAPIMNLTGGINVDAIASGLGPLASVANSSYFNATASNLITIATTSLLGSDQSLFNDGALEEQAVMNLMATFKSGLLNTSAASLNNTRTLLANMRLSDIVTDGTNFYTADGISLGGIGDIKVAGAEAFLGGTMSDSSFCTTPIGLCALFMALKAQIKTQADLDKLRQGGRDPLDLIGAPSEPSIADRLLLQLKAWINGLGLNNSLSPTTTPIPNSLSSNSFSASTAFMQLFPSTLTNVGSLAGETFDQASAILTQGGFLYLGKISGYDRWISSDGSTVSIGASGQVVRAGRTFTLVDGKMFNPQYDQFGNPFVSDSTIGSFTGEVLDGGSINKKQNDGPIPGVKLVTPAEPNAVATLTGTPNKGLISLPTITTTPDNGPDTGTTTITPATNPWFANRNLPGFCDNCTPITAKDLNILSEQFVSEKKDPSSKLFIRQVKDDFGQPKTYIMTENIRELNFDVVGEAMTDRGGRVNFVLDMNALKASGITPQIAFNVLINNTKPGYGIEEVTGISATLTGVNSSLDIKVLNEYVLNGQTVEAAAKSTPVGQFASKLGYTQVYKGAAELTSPGNVVSANAWPYKYVNVTFTKPPGK